MCVCVERERERGDFKKKEMETCVYREKEGGNFFKKEMERERERDAIFLNKEMETCV